MKPIRVLCCVLLLLVAVHTVLDAQRRGGGPGGGGPGGAGGFGGRGGGGGARKGTVETVTMRAKSLEGNTAGESADRTLSVYLPPSYASDQKRRFPVVYLLHGAGATETTFIDGIGRLVESADALSSAQGFSEAIIVTPNAVTKAAGGMYGSSAATGDWEKFVAEDLVSYIDGKYRTMAARISRGLAGHGTGGYAALRIAMKSPEKFFGLYIMSPCCLDAAGIAAIERDAQKLQSYYAVAFDVGAKDPQITQARALHDALTRQRVPHYYEEYDGDQTSKVRERLDRRVIPFFSTYLVAAANPSSPQVKQ